MKISARCYGCVYCQMCDKEQEQECANEHYIFFTTDAQKKLYDLLCGEIGDLICGEENDYN